VPAPALPAPPVNKTVPAARNDLSI
jgi:hypothetical protein